MSDTQSNHFSDEDKYDDDSFETLLPEPSVNGSEDDLIDDDKRETALNKPHLLPQKSDYWPGESSSDEDDVVLGQTIAEINTDPIEFDCDSLSLTPAARLFKMASATRDGLKSNGMTECEESDDDIEEEDDVIQPCNGDREKILTISTKLTERSEKLLTYNEEILLETSGIEIDEEFTEVYDICDCGEVDVGEPNIYEELAEGDKEEDEELFAENYKDEDGGFLSDEIFETGYGDEAFYDEKDNEIDDEDGDSKTLGARSSIAQSMNEDAKSETKSLRTDDSMEEFKRKVMLSQRIRCVSDGAGDGTHIISRKSSIPVWIGRDRFTKLGNSTKISHCEPGLRSMIPVPEVRKYGSQPDFSDADTLTPHDEDNNENDDEDNNENEDDYMYEVCEEFSEYNASATSENAALCSYSMHLDMFTGPKETSTQRKKLKPNERRNKSFSNDRLRDIERHNNILLHKILNQKPTYVLDEKKKKNNKFASLPPTTRVTSAEINRKKQQRQIDMDNQLLKRKLETIAKRKTKAKK